MKRRKINEKQTKGEHNTFWIRKERKKTRTRTSEIVKWNITLIFMRSHVKFTVEWHFSSATSSSSLFLFFSSSSDCIVHCVLVKWFLRFSFSSLSCTDACWRQRCFVSMLFFRSLKTSKKKTLRREKSESFVVSRIVSQAIRRLFRSSFLVLFFVVVALNVRVHVCGGAIFTCAIFAFDSSSALYACRLWLRVCVGYEEMNFKCSQC